MDKQILTTYTVNEGAHFGICPVDCEVLVNDYSSRETISVEALSRGTVQHAINRYVDNAHKHMTKAEALAWLNSLKEVTKQAIKACEDVEVK
jgi:RNase P/RNase MRP subunit POP5